MRPYIARHAMVGTHPAMMELYAAIDGASPGRLPVVVAGPTGAGKECVAEAIHAASGRSGRYVVVNVTTLPDTLIDSELFGSTRGAFSGAENRTGLIEAADGGTVVLDEASDLSLAVQAKLLRVIESRKLRRIGSAREQSVDFRLIVTTQHSPTALVKSGQWRPDFYHRVAGASLRVPSLAEHASDVPSLVRHFAAHAGVADVVGSLGALERLPWPGNVRQLARLVESEGLRSGGDALDADKLRLAAERESSALEPAVTALCTLEEASIRHVQAVFQACAGDTIRAAAILGLSRSQVYRRLARLSPTA